MSHGITRMKSGCMHDLWLFLKWVNLLESDGQKDKKFISLYQDHYIMLHDFFASGSIKFSVDSPKKNNQ